MATEQTKPSQFTSSIALYAGEDRQGMALLERETHGQLSCWDPASGKPMMVFLHYALADNGKTVLGHLANPNPMLKLLEKSPSATLWVEGPSAYIPSHFSGGPRATPTSYYSWVQLEVSVELVYGHSEILSILKAMLDRLQSEGDHPPVDPDDTFWQGMLGAITGLRMRVDEIQTRQKYGQNRSPAQRIQIAEALKKRNLPLDALTAARVIDLLDQGQGDS